MKPTFRIATLTDLDILMELESEFHQHFGYPFEAESIRTILVPPLQDPSLGRMLLIQVDGAIAGYLFFAFGYSIESGGRDGIIDEFYIREAYRNQGIGKMTMEYLLTVLAPAWDVKKIFFEVERTNTKAHAFYRRFGFVDHDRYLMERSLLPLE